MRSWLAARLRRATKHEAASPSVESTRATLGADAKPPAVLPDWVNIADLAELRRFAEEDGRSIVIVSHDDRLREVADRILWLEDGTFRELAGMVTDPVCGMAVEPAGNPTTILDGTRWWFCSTHCHEEFTADPSRFIRPPDQ